jgi:hypothetical protein
MKRLILVPVIAAVPLLSGCLPMMAVSAVDLAARSAQGTPTSNADLHPDASEACTQRAAQYGTVSVIDVEQHSIDKIIVWGTVDDGKQRRSFECDFGTKITGFKLRAIPSEQ